MSKHQEKEKEVQNVFINKQKSTCSTVLIKPTTSQTSSTKKNTAKPLYACVYCQKHFPYPSALKQHLVMHTGQNDYKCNLCDFSAPRNSSLNDHIRRHVNECQFKCTETDCQAAFLYASALTRHQWVHRKNDESLQKLVCSQCTYKTHRKDSLTQHVKFTHSRLKMIICPHEHCTYRAKHKGNLKKHLSVHSSEKRHVCPEPNCGFKTKRSGCLRRHIKTHLPEEKKCKCNYCEYSCHRYSNLIRHTRIHTLETPYFCKTCTYKSKNPGGLTRHMKKHVRDQSNA